jgi:hypothetical protein
MNKFYAVIGLLFVFQGAKAQELVPNPFFPLDTNTVTITVNCALGNQGLYNYGDTGVYVHIGLITDSSTNSSDWRYVPFTWGTANPAAAATSLGNNFYAFTIHNIRAYFGVPAAEIIYKVAILYRNASGSLAQRNSDGSDMFIAVYPVTLSGTYTLPPFQPTYIPTPQPINQTIGSTLPIQFKTNKTAGISLFFNGDSVAGVSNADSVMATVLISSAGNQQVIAKAGDGINSLTDTLNFFVPGANKIAALPTGANEGINYLPGDSSALLVLYAPLKHKIVVVGDFNNWTQDTAYQMYETPDSNYYWLQINGLASGTEYAYQYVIDDTLQLADYNTEKVLDQAVDPTISATTYPNLKPFPAGASGTLTAILETGQPVYNWQVTNFQRPPNSNLRVYELLVRDFLLNNNWQTLADSINYLKTLGVNAIEVMPFSNFEGASSWGYNPNFYFAPDKVYGTPTALKQFIDICHQHGMAVIMDIVMNHSFGSSPMVQMYWDGANNIPAANSPWFSQYYTHDYDVGYQFNNASQATMTFRERVIAYWLKNYHIDGYRFDLATGYTKVNSCTNNGTVCNDAIWDAYDTTRINIWNTLYAAGQAASPGCYFILEMFSENLERAVYANNNMMVWNNMSSNYEQATMGYSTGWDLSGSTAANTGVPQPGLMNYQESHDQERLMYDNETNGNSNSLYNIKDTATGLVRDEMAAAVWAMIPGPKMMWMFGEMGYDYSINWCPNGTVDPSGSCRTDPKPVRWDYLQVAGRKHLQTVYTSLFKLADSFPSLATSTTASYSLTGAVKTVQVTSPGISVAVIGNFDIAPNAGTITFPTAGSWYNYLGSDSITATGSAQSITLSAGEYKVYTSLNLNDTTTKGGGTPPPPPDTSSVNGIVIAPNPVLNSSSVITYTLSVSSDVDLGIYNMLGQRLGSYDLGTQATGTHTLSFNDLPFNTSALKNGVYILKLNSSGKTMHVSFLSLH